VDHEVLVALALDYRRGCYLMLAQVLALALVALFRQMLKIQEYQASLVEEVFSAALAEAVQVVPI
jgi:hypothetical protein